MAPIIKFAIADDHEIVRKGEIELINSFGGFELVVDAENGKELYDKLLACATLPDVVVMDISMPVWDGYMALDAIRKKWPDMKVLIITMHKHEFAIIRMFRSGANGYLLKSCRPRELHEALRSVAERGYYLPEIATSNIFRQLKESATMPTLSEKEIQLLKLCPTEMTYTEIAKEMATTERSVSNIRTGLFDKLGVNSRAGLVVCAIEMGLFPV